MSKIKLSVESVQVTEGQGVGEGDFELRIQASDGSKTVTWPSLNGWVKVDKGGAAQSVNMTINTYTVESGTLSKRITIDVTEVDGGTLGKDDQGQGTLTFDLTPTMAATSKVASIRLKRPSMDYLGTVKVTVTAQRV